MNTKRLFLYSILAITALGFLFLSLTGCSQNEHTEEADPYPDMTSELRNLQGSWVDVDTNDSVQCSAVILGYTIRVRYQDDKQEILQKQNACIDELDKERHLMLVNGKTGAWHYDYSPEESGEKLKLEFFASDGWHTMNLCRAH